MLSSAKNWVEDKAATYLKAGVQAGGTLAGNAVGGVGSLVENAGQTAGNTVSGGIGGVGNYINGYGESIKSSMSADGPVSGSAKKTAVKPSGTTEKGAQASQKTLASSATAKKTPPSTTGAQKTLPSASQRVGQTPKPAQPVSKTNPGGAQRNKSAPTHPPQGANTKARTAPAAKTISTGVGSKASPYTSKPQTNVKSQPNVAADGKVKISPQSRPKVGSAQPAARTIARTGAGPENKKHGSDPLGIGANFGDISKNKSKDNDPKAQSQFRSQPHQQNSKKPSAADPLAIGNDIAEIGKKK